MDDDSPDMATEFSPGLFIPPADWWDDEAEEESIP